MAGALLYASAAAATVFGGAAAITTGLVDAPPNIVVDRVAGIVRHEWPIRAANRKALFDKLFAGGGADAMRLFFEANASKTREQLLAEHETNGGGAVGDEPKDDHTPFLMEMARRRPGLWAELSARGCSIRNAVGVCIGAVIGNDVAVVLDPAAPVRRGDVVFFAMRGALATYGKVWLGTKDGLAYFWMSEPDTVIAVDVANVLHMARVIMVQPRAGAPFEPPFVEFKGLSTEDWQPPKMASFADALEAAWWSILDAARVLN